MMLNLKQESKENDRENCIIRSFIISSLHLTLLRWSNQGWKLGGTEAKGS